MKNMDLNAKIATLLLTVMAIFPGCSGKPESGKTPINDSQDKAVLPETFTVGPEAFVFSGGHIQGMATSDDALYLSQATYLSRVSWTGKLLASKIVTRHTGDLCWYDGELFTSLALTSTGKIQVFDKNLTLKRECDIDHTVDGITCLDGILYVGMGAKTEPSSEPHRINIIGRFDAKTLEEIGERVEFDYGYETKFGFQNITNDGKNLYASFYAVEGAPQIVKFDKDFKILKTIFYDGSGNNGFDLMPAKYRGAHTVFIMGTTNLTSSTVSCDISYWRP